MTDKDKNNKDKKNISEEINTEATSDEAVTEVEATSDETVQEKNEKKLDDINSGLKLPFIIGKKIGMSQIFSNEGIVIPVTIVKAGPCHVTQLKTLTNDGYSAVQLAYLDKKKKKTNKSLIGHFEKAGIPSKKYLKEFKYLHIDEIELGSEININQYVVGDLVNVTGITKGKGFAGHMKRHNFSGGRASHGKNSVMRKAGSVGAGTDPGKVWKGTRMAGRMGNDKLTTKNIKVVRLDENKNLIFLKGAIPGSNNKIVYLNKSK